MSAMMNANANANANDMIMMISLNHVNRIHIHSAIEQDLKWILYICENGTYRYKVNKLYSGYKCIVDLYEMRSMNLSNRIHITTVINMIEGRFCITEPLPYTVSVLLNQRESTENNWLYDIFMTNHDNIFITLKIESYEKDFILNSYSLLKGSIYMKYDGMWNIGLINSIQKLHVLEDSLSISTTEMYVEDELLDEIKQVLDESVR